MKIKTLTTYDVYNFGASLQAYALQTYLSNLGNEVEIINYQPDYLTRKYDYKWVNPESSMSKFLVTRIIYRILKFLQRQTTLKRKRKFDIFNHQVLKETSHKYLTYKELQMNPPEADLFFVGSDQIWNTFYEAGRDPAFYLEFVHKGKKASYAASFSYLDIDDMNLKRIQKSLKKFQAVSVREYHGLEILNKIGVQGTWVLDPVFLLSQEEWIKLMTPFSKTEKYLLIYDFEKNKDLKEFALLYAKEKNLKIYAINDTYPLAYADRNFNNAGPKEFISLIYHCDAFISNSFHGTAFSIIFNKPVFVFNRHRHKVNSRMESLMSLFNLKNFIINDKSMYETSIKASIDYEEVNSIIKAETIKSKQFISQLL